MADQDVPKTETPVETTAEGSTAPAAPAVDPQTAAAAAGVPDALDPSAIEKHVALSEVARQISFYFGDANYPFDRFLFMLSRKSPEGWVPISIIASFKRMKPMRFLLTDEEIATSVEEAMQLQEDPLVEVDESKTKIRRKRELVPKKDAFARSAYVKGFGEETGELQKDLEAFFAEYGDIAQVRMRRDKGRGFKGSVFVEFHNFKELQEFVQLGQKADDDDERPKWEGHPLQIMTKEAYCDMKMEEKGIDKTKSSVSRGKETKETGPVRFNAFREMEREAAGLPAWHDTDSQQSGAAPKPNRKPDRSEPLELEFNGKTLTTRADGTVDPDEVAFPEQSVLAFEGAGEGGHWRDLKETLLTILPTSFVEFPEGAVKGAVGFTTPVAEDKFKEIIDRAILVGGQPVAWSRVADQDAKKFYVDRANFRAKWLLDARSNPTNGHGRGGKSGRGGRGGRGGGGGGGGRGGRGGRGGGRGGRGAGRGGRGGQSFSRSSDRKRENGDQGDSDRPNKRQATDAPPVIGSAVKREA